MANAQEDNMLTANQQRALDLLLRLKHEFDPSHLSEACRELTGLIVNQSDCIQILEDYHAQGPVIDMMEHRTYEADIQQVSTDSSTSDVLVHTLYKLYRAQFHLFQRPLDHVAFGYKRG